MNRVLLVDDDTSYADNLKHILSAKGYEVDYIDDPMQAVVEFTKRRYDLVISDYMMTELNGVQLVTLLKGINPEVKTMILTGFPQEESENEALNINVDRYLSKDKSLSLLCNYVDGLIQQAGTEVEPADIKLISKEDGITIDLSRHEVYKDGELVNITRKEYEILVLFLRNKGIALSRESIAEQIWTQDIEEIDLRVIDGHIKRLRSKLKLFSIISIRGYGYKWNEQ